MRYLLLLCLLFVRPVQAHEAMDLRSYGQESPHTIYVFTSHNFWHCRDYHKLVWPDLVEKFVNTGKARLFVVDMPVTRAGMDAAKLLRCLPSDKAMKVEGWIYENQSRWMHAPDANKIFLKYAQAVGMNSDEFNKCLADDALEAAILKQREQFAVLYGVQGTPTTILRQGNVVKKYVGVERKAILRGLEEVISDFEKQKGLSLKDE